MQRVKTLVKTLAGSIATGSFVVNTFSHNWAVFIVSLYLPCNGDVWSNPGSTYITGIFYQGNPARFEYKTET